MGVGEDRKIEWTAAVAAAVAISDTASRVARASGLRDGLNKIPVADRWTDERGTFWGLRSGWSTWARLDSDLAEAQGFNKGVGASVPNPLGPGGPVHSISIPGLGSVGSDWEGIKKTPVGGALDDVGRGVAGAAKAVGDLGAFVPILVVAVVLLAVYRRAS